MSRTHYQSHRGIWYGNRRVRFTTWSMREGLCILILTVLLLFCNFEKGWMSWWRIMLSIQFCIGSNPWVISVACGNLFLIWKFKIPVLAAALPPNRWGRCMHFLVLKYDSKLFCTPTSCSHVERCILPTNHKSTTNRNINILLFGYWLSIPYPHQIISNTMTSLVIHSVDNTCCIVPLDVLLKSKMRRALWWHQVLPAYTVLPHYWWRTKWMVTYNM